jgi:hypothetical protein
MSKRTSESLEVGAEGLSGKQKGDLHVVEFKKVIDTLERLPSRAGKVAMTALAAKCGFSRGVLYQNPNVRRALEERARAEGLMIPAAKEVNAEGARDVDKSRLEARVLKLEQRVASLSAENAELRRQLRQYAHVEDAFVRTGRRIKL